MMSILQQYKQYLPYYHIVNEYVEITAKSFDKYLSEIIICLFWSRSSLFVKASAMKEVLSISSYYLSELFLCADNGDPTGIVI